MKDKLFILTNERISFNEGKFFCDNIDIKTTPEGLNKKFEVNLLGRKSNKNRSHEIKLKRIKIFSNILSYIFSVFNFIKNKNSKFLIISITPFTFVASIILRLYGKKPIIYLRSDGYGEYNAIIGKAGQLIYHLMFNIICSFSNLISFGDHILRGKKGKIVTPSQLDSVWLKKPKNNEIKSFKLLYVGRFKIEKGIFSLINLIKNKKNISLSIIGAEKVVSDNFKQSNVKILKIENNKLRLIKHYDDHDIFILPSYTEGYGMVILEALARRRPVIIFEDIKHVIKIIGNKKGIFVSKRNFLSLFATLNEIKKNYKKIQKEMKKNKLPLYKEFIDKLSQNILSFDK
jgi:glycosyltransferase involved in cell wall biosynthesis